MYSQHREECSEQSLITFCKKLASSNHHFTEEELRTAPEFALAYAQGHIDTCGVYCSLTHKGKIWLRRKLSNGGTGNHIRAPEASPASNANTESPLAWLRSRKDRAGHSYISQEQFDAGERMRADFTYAQLWGTVKSNWRGEKSPASGICIDDVTDSVYDARQRLQKALSAVGPELSGVLLDICCFLKPLKQVEREHNWPQRTAKVVLGLGLDRLSKHYGYKQDCAAGMETTRLQSWHAPNSEQVQPTHHS